MGYDMPNGLAKSAYSVGGRSIAVDKGAVRVTDKSLIGTTNDVKYTVLVADSTAVTKTDGGYDTQTTIRDILDSVPTNYIDPLGRIDVGYHYGGKIVYPIEILSKASTKMNGTDRFFRFTDIHEPPQPGLTLKDKAIASANFNKTDLADTTIVLYTAKDTSQLFLTVNPINNSTTTTAWNNAVAYHVVGTPINRTLVTYPTFNASTEPMGMRSLSLSASPSGKIFAGVFFNSNVTTSLTGTTTYTHTEEIHIYNYSFSADTWIEIAHYIQYGGTGIQTYGPDTAIISGVITSDDTIAVWVAWYEKLASDTSLSLRSAYLPQNPASVTDINTTIQLIKDKTKITFLTHGKLDITYDPTIIRTPYNGDARLIYHEELPATSILSTLVQARVVKFSTDKSLGNITFDGTFYTLESTTTSRTPRIVYNANDTSGGKSQAFVSFRISSNPSSGPLRDFDLDTTSPSGEQWNLDTTVSNVYNGNEPDITYRGNGDKIIVWGHNDDEISSNVLSDVIEITSSQTPNITTSKGNNRDLYLSCEDQYYYDPNSDIQSVVIVRELYP